MTPDSLELLRATANRYLGSHNFHNFTIGREFRDRSSNRHMKEISVSAIHVWRWSSRPDIGMKVSDPVVYGNTEWVSINFHGQSFMLHQVCDTPLRVIVWPTLTIAQIVRFTLEFIWIVGAQRST